MRLQFKVALFLLQAVALLAGNAAQAQTNLEVFGHNRIQYRKYDWKYFETKHFRIYHYDAAGKQLARYVSEQVENDITIVEKRMGGSFPRKFSIVVYNSYDEYRQSNIGRKFDSQLTEIPAGTVDVVGDKLVVYFTGVHTDLRRQTREGMARAIMERLLFGENFREIVKNSILLNLPRWTLYGFTTYLIDGWDTKTNSDWKNLIDAHPKAGFFELAEDHPELAGKAFWKYIADKYGDGTMHTLLYNTQNHSNLNAGIKMTLNQNVKKAYDSAMAYFKTVYQKDELNQETPDSTAALLYVDVPKGNSIIRSLKVAPKGHDVAYVGWKNGEYKVYLQNTTGYQNRAVILDGGDKDFAETQGDPNYPLLAWSNSGYKLAILYKKGTQVRLRIYNSIKAKIENYTIPANRFDRVLSMTFNEDDDRLVFSAIKKSQTDLYEFIIRGSRMKNITNDAWDDTDPFFVSGGSKRGILFLSNRSKPNLEVPLEVNQLPTGPMNVFFYDTRTKRKELLQMSNVTTGNVSQPIQYGSDNFAYLYDANGINNQYIVSLMRNKNNRDSAVAVPVTNYPSSVISHQYNAASRQAATVVQKGDKYVVYFRPLQIPGKNAEVKTLSPTTLSQTEGAQQKQQAVNLNTETGASEPSGGSDILKSGNVFQSEFKDAAADKPILKPAKAKTEADTNIAVGLVSADSAYVKMKAQPYRHAFKPDFFTIKIDNSVLFNKYQSVSQTGGKWVNPSLGAMLTVSLDDLMENHRLTGGIRLPVNFTGLTYFMQYENVKRRVDWNLLYLRSETTQNYVVNYIDTATGAGLVNEQLGRIVTNIVQGTASYPIDRRRSVRLTLGGRADNMKFKSQDTLSLSYKPNDPNQFWGMSRAEYVFDNTSRPTINIFNGTRLKFFAEYMYRLNGQSTGCYNFGADYRTYAKLYKNFIWANRIAFAHSGGDSKIVYHLGGVDNWLNSKYSDYVPLRPTENYAFEALATNLRGYKQNARNGNTYAVFNSELRLPLLTTFIKRPIQSAMLRNLQLVAFTDIGSAWQGLYPTVDRMRNNRFLPDPNDPGSNGQVTLNVIDETGGLAMGYGGGLRTMIFGYFLRLDAAKGINGGKGIIYFSIGTDF